MRFARPNHRHPTNILYKGTKYTLVSAAPATEPEEILAPTDEELDKIVEHHRPKLPHGKKREWVTRDEPLPPVQKLPPAGTPRHDPRDKGLSVSITILEYSLLQAIPTVQHAKNFENLLNRIEKKLEKDPSISVELSEAETDALYDAVKFSIEAVEAEGGNPAAERLLRLWGNQTKVAVTLQQFEFLARFPVVEEVVEEYDAILTRIEEEIKHKLNALTYSVWASPIEISEGIKIISRYLQSTSADTPEEQEDLATLGALLKRWQDSFPSAWEMTDVSVEFNSDDYDFLEGLVGKPSEPVFNNFMKRAADEIDANSALTHIQMTKEEVAAVLTVLKNLVETTDDPEMHRQAANMMRRWYVQMMHWRHASARKIIRYKGALYRRVADRSNVEDDPYSRKAPERVWLRDPETEREPPTRGLPKYVKSPGKEQAERQYEEIAQDVAAGDWSRLYDLIGDVADPALVKIPSILNQHNMTRMSKLLDAANTINGIIGRGLQDLTIKMKSGIINRRYPTKYGTPSLEQIFDDPERYKEWLTEINTGLRAFMLDSPRLVAAAEVQTELFEALSRQLVGRGIYTPEALEAYRGKIRGEFEDLLEVELSATEPPVKTKVRKVRTTV